MAGQSRGQFFKHYPDPAFLCDIQTLQITAANHAACRLYGYAVDDFCALSVSDLASTPERGEWHQAVRSGSASVVTHNLWKHVTRSGELILVRATLSDFENGCGLSRLLSVVDLSRHLHDDGKLQPHIPSKPAATNSQGTEDRQRAVDRFNMITQATRDVVWEWDLSTNTVWRSETYEKEYGHAPEPENSGPEGIHIHDEDRERILSSLRTFLKGNTDLWSEEYRLMAADGEVKWVSDRAMADRGPDGEAQRIIGLMTDITTSRLLEERIKRAERLESLGELTGGIAHDFNNLLTVLLGTSERLADRLPEGQLKEMAELSLSACESGSELVKRLLAFARRQSLLPTAVDLGERLSETAPLLQRSLTESIALDLISGPDLEQATLDVAQFDTALLNLCLNAKDAMPQGGNITIELANVTLNSSCLLEETDVQPGAYVMVAVSDTGEGMEEYTLEHAFEPFFTTKPPSTGSGLGLSMVYGFVKQSGGHIAIDSQKGKGTTVRMYFPTAGGLPKTIRQREENTREDLPEMTVLIVEDNAFVLAHAKRLLNELGMTTISAATAGEALELLESTPQISFLFTDIILPGGMNGVELAEEARMLRPGLPTLYTTGYTTNSIVAKEHLDPTVSILPKPYRRANLVDKIREVLEASGKV
ncbi:MAG: ATP-binding protein [Henriciella sp.]|uniref:hybrid sensor histidine kinase/response regulator n=1 Tax=Henriciella sp. TaxID=1968823 RepID=UPI0032ED74C8